METENDKDIEDEKMSDDEDDSSDSNDDDKEDEDENKLKSKVESLKEQVMFGQFSCVAKTDYT